MANGVWTAQVAGILQKEFDKRGFDVLHDHGQKGDLDNTLGTLRSWFESESDSGSTRETALADLDLAVVSRDPNEANKVYALVEIEETTHHPKIILGDIFATLLGDGVIFQGKRPLDVGKWTTLIVLAHSEHNSHRDRIVYLEKQANQLKTYLSTKNASIGQIVLDTFQERADLEVNLRRYIEESLSRAGV
jgi:hypothetical protein